MTRRSLALRSGCCGVSSSVGSSTKTDSIDAAWAVELRRVVAVTGLRLPSLLRAEGDVPDEAVVEVGDLALVQGLSSWETIRLTTTGLKKIQRRRRPGGKEAWVSV
tara:strand:- start:765 stop:1082 length:318 start_codon:yes stop_codon:yes gene_type:complete